LSKQSKPNIGLFVAIGVAATLVLTVISQYFTYQALGVRSENTIEATWNNNKQILGTYTTKVQEIAQVPSMARDDLTKVMEAAFQGRYGEKGSQATMQWIKESYPGQLDPKLYTRIQDVMDSGRTDFSENQKTLIDKKQTYQSQLDTAWSGFWLKMAGFPKKDLSKFNIITSTAAEHSFSTGVDDGVRIRP